MTGLRGSIVGMDLIINPRDWASPSLPPVLFFVFYFLFFCVSLSRAAKTIDWIKKKHLFFFPSRAV